MMPAEPQAASSSRKGEVLPRRGTAEEHILSPTLLPDISFAESKSPKSSRIPFSALGEA